MIRFTAAVLAATVALAPFAASAAPDPSTREERVQKRADMMTKRFAKLDKNKDGAVDKAELTASMEKAFNRADANKDGVIDEAEVKTIRDKAAARRGDRPAKAGKKDRFAKADKDKDGKITMDEFVATGTPWLLRADTNKDGSVTKAELDAQIGKLQKRADKADAKRAAQ